MPSHTPSSTGPTWRVHDLGGGSVTEVPVTPGQSGLDQETPGGVSDPHLHTAPLVQTELETNRVMQGAGRSNTIAPIVRWPSVRLPSRESLQRQQQRLFGNLGVLGRNSLTTLKLTLTYALLITVLTLLYGGVLLAQQVRSEPNLLHAAQLLGAVVLGAILTPAVWTLLRSCRYARSFEPFH